jgi:hypothetical protein
VGTSDSGDTVEHDSTSILILALGPVSIAALLGALLLYLRRRDKGEPPS